MASTHPISGAVGARKAFSDLQSAFASGRTRDLAWRRQQLEALERMMAEREDEIAAALTADLGKHPFESWVTETSFVAGEAKHYRRHVGKWSKPRRVHTPVVAQPATSWIQPEPLGVVLIIGAWNYPLQLTMSVLAAAIAAGNCAIVKPSEVAANMSSLLAQLVPEYLDNDCIRIVEGGVNETTELLNEPFDHILYTGGGQVGRIVMEAAAKNLTPVTLELGGKSPCVVLPDADLETAARRILWGKLTNAGQTCIAPDYILTDSETESKLVPIMANIVSEMYGDDPEQSESYGRIINERHFERLRGLLDSGDVAIGGTVNSETRYIAPTVLTNVSPDSPVMQQEIFGPILPIIRAESLDDAIRFIKRGDKPLSAYLFTRSRASEDEFLLHVSGGNVCINDTMMFMAVPGLPFGGVGESGMGVYHGRYGFDTFSHLKSVIRRGWWPDIAARYAPFTDGKFAFLRKIL